MKKIVVKLDVHGVKEKQKAMQTVSTISGIESFEIDMNDQKLIITGDIDPVDVIAKLRKDWYAEIVSFGPAPVMKNEEIKTDVEQNNEDTKKDDDDDDEHLEELIMASNNYYPNPYHPWVQVQPSYYYCYVPRQQYPNACVIS